MAKKSTSKKSTSKKSTSGKPQHDIDQAELTRQLRIKAGAQWGKHVLQSRVLGTPPNLGGTPLGTSSSADMKYASIQRQEMEKQYQQYRRQERVSSRIANDIARNLGNNYRTFAMGPGKAPDKLSGRTVEFGTRSMLEGIKGWMRGGGGLRRGSM